MSHALATVRHDGRRPSVTPGTRYEKIIPSREAATDDQTRMAAAHAAAAICRPLGARQFRNILILGLLTAGGRRDAHSPGCGRCRTRCRDSGSTRSPAERGFTPQANYLSPLRGFALSASP